VACQTASQLSRNGSRGWQRGQACGVAIFRRRRARVGRRQYYGSATSQRTRGTQRRGHSASVNEKLCAGGGCERGALGGAGAGDGVGVD
jgi:hypothetical protein